MNTVCVECGKKADGFLVKDVRNIASGGEFYCYECAAREHHVVDEDGMSTVVVREFDPEEVAQMLNPDIACDFCSKPDPQWEYTMDQVVLHVEIMGISETLDFGDRWVSCNECDVDAQKKDYVSTTERNPLSCDEVQKGLMLPLHKKVMNGIKTREPYVRNNKDGKIRRV